MSGPWRGAEWLQHPISNRAQEDTRLLRLIRASFVASHGIYGAPRVFLDLREAGETCSKHRVARLMREANLRALHGYRMRRWAVGKPSVLIPNLLQRQFTATHPNRTWVTDITYIRTWQGGLYLAVVMDLFSRRIVGWARRRGTSPRARAQRGVDGRTATATTRHPHPLGSTTRERKKASSPTPVYECIQPSKSDPKFGALVVSNFLGFLRKFSNDLVHSQQSRGLKSASYVTNRIRGLRSQ